MSSVLQYHSGFIPPSLKYPKYPDCLREPRVLPNFFCGGSVMSVTSYSSLSVTAVLSAAMKASGSPPS